LPFVKQSKPPGHVTYINFDSFDLVLVVNRLEIKPTLMSSSICINSQVKVISVLRYFHGTA
jgi:hypothetical protein